MTLRTSPVCGCGHILVRVADRITREGASYREECPTCGPAPRLVEPIAAEWDEEREAIEMAAVALDDRFAVVSA